jgi:hypothetical protein
MQIKLLAFRRCAMNILFAAIVLALICLLVIWLVPNWDALSAQLNAYFLGPPRTQADEARIQPPPSRKHLQDDPPARPQTGQRHTVVPHQARGR